MNQSDTNDHNYSDCKLNTNISKNTIIVQSTCGTIYSQVGEPGKNKYIGLKIKDLNDLKKATPQVKLPAGITPTLKMKNIVVAENVKQKLEKYCRACAGIKVPLVDIFSDRGIQMRLNQQLQHLEINKDDALTTKLCMDCICDLKSSYKFFMQIKKAEVKLKSISNSLVNSKSASETNNVKTNSDNDDAAFCSFTDTAKISKEDHLDDKYAGASSNSDDFDDNNFVEFDNDVSNSNVIESKIESDCKFSIDLNDTKPKLDVKDLKSAFNIDEELKADTKVTSDKSIEDIQKEANVDINFKNSITNVNSTVNLVNLLKRKESSSLDSQDFQSKKSHKWNLDFKDIKIPKLNLDDPNLKQDEQGVMYVTAKGSKPNEVLLIKVKKMDKSEKKGEKAKKGSAPPMKSTNLKHGYLSNKLGTNFDQSNIDMQIEQYKKKRAEILGEQVDLLQEKSVETIIIKEEHSGFTDVSENLEYDSTKLEQPVKLQETHKEIKNKSDDIKKSLQEECTDRLKKIFRQKKELVADFATFLRQRRIIASRVNEEYLISMFEQKYNIVYDRNAPEEPETDPLLESEASEMFDCDFCFRSFDSVETSFEHSKIHDIRFMYLCADCGEEFSSTLKRREHNAGCIQKKICKVCNEVQESKGKKRLHEQKHCDQKYGQICEICGEKFKNQSTLEQHIKGRHMQHEKIFQCPECPKEFAFKTKLNFHVKTVHTTFRAFLCEDCGKDFKNPASLRHHKVCKHLGSKNKKECSVCHKMIPAYSMSKHKSTHRARGLKCPHCDKMFKNTSTLKQHTRIHEDQRQYKCDMCGVGFNRRDGLKLHMRVHMKQDSRGLKECACQVCGEKFPSHSTLVIHRNRTHKDGRVYTCHICNRSMISKRSLEWHLSHIHNENFSSEQNEEQQSSNIDSETRRVTCSHCKKTFKTETILRTHIKNSHTEKVPIKCEICDVEFTSEVRMKHHMMTEHQRFEGTEKCPHCPKRFVNLLRLKTHMIAHSDERPFACDQCGFLLKTRIQLIKHKQNRHSDERPLQCKYCTWRCKQVSALVCHERTHTNERPYSCSVCKQRFKYLGDKNKHERRHESLGGSGFKRIVNGRNNSNNSNDNNKINCNVNNDSYAEPKIETFDETRVIKFETGEIVAESEATFEPVSFSKSSFKITKLYNANIFFSFSDLCARGNQYLCSRSYYWHK